jgi:hypothetical protein
MIVSTSKWPSTPSNQKKKRKKIIDIVAVMTQEKALATFALSLQKD